MKTECFDSALTLCAKIEDPNVDLVDLPIFWGEEVP